MSAMPAAFAQANSITVPISKGDLPKIDGAWNSPDEWKQASVTFVNFTDGTELVIKAKHDINSLYVLLEMSKDARMDGHGVVCLDTLNDGGYYMETDDFCFTLGNLVRVYQGNGKTTVMMHEIPVSHDLRAARDLTTSPYSSDEHVSYEFKIPLREFGPVATEYGIYTAFDTRGQTDDFTYYYSWPEFKTDSYLDVPTPRSWNKISLSPDADVPEFPLFAIGEIGAIVGLVTVLTRTKLLMG